MENRLQKDIEELITNSAPPPRSHSRPRGFPCICRPSRFYVSSN